MVGAGDADAGSAREGPKGAAVMSSASATPSAAPAPRALVPKIKPPHTERKRSPFYRPGSVQAMLLLGYFCIPWFPIDV